jgi:hypothetical protein
MQKHISLPKIKNPTCPSDPYDSDISDISLDPNLLKDPTDKQIKQSLPKINTTPGKNTPDQFHESESNHLSASSLPQIETKHKRKLTFTDAIHHFNNNVYIPFKLIYRAIDRDSDFLDPSTFLQNKEEIKSISKKLTQLDPTFKLYPCHVSIKFELINNVLKDKYICFLSYLDALDYDGILKQLLALTTTNQISMKNKFDTQLNQLYEHLNPSSTKSNQIVTYISFDEEYLTLCGSCARVVTQHYYNQIDSINSATSIEELNNSLATFLCFILDFKNFLYKKLYRYNPCKSEDILMSKQDFLTTLTILFNPGINSDSKFDSDTPMNINLSFFEDSQQKAITNYLNTQIKLLIDTIQPHIYPHYISKYENYYGRNFNNPEELYITDNPR